MPDNAQSPKKKIQRSKPKHGFHKPEPAADGPSFEDRWAVTRELLKLASLDAYTPKFLELGLDDTLYLVQLAKGAAKGSDGEAEELEFLMYERAGMKERHFNKLREALLAHRLAAFPKVESS